MRGVIGSVLRAHQSRRDARPYVATDHVIESFRNRMWRGIQDRRGRRSGSAFPVPAYSRRLSLPLGVVVWAMVEEEADDAPGGSREDRGR